MARRPYPPAMKPTTLMTLAAGALIVALVGPALAETRDELFAQIIVQTFPKCIHPVSQLQKGDCALIRMCLDRYYEIYITKYKLPPIKAAKAAASVVESEMLGINGRRKGREHSRWVPNEEDVSAVGRNC